MHVIVAYDIVADRRRNRLAKKLSTFILRVQKSVFEGELTSDRYQKMLDMITREIDPDEDNVRIYHLCRRCVKPTLVIGVAVWIPMSDEDELY